MLSKRLDLQDNSIKLEDLAIVRLLGSGMFGHVFLTAHKYSNRLYALKTVNKRKIAGFEIYNAL